ncbi:MAG: hypothetical protein G8237_11720 [Magnetococcales bacterium]|nr:hypothetical protein [Magnetococcales bacterium]
MRVNHADYWEVAVNLDPNVPLDTGTMDLYVDTSEARGDVTQDDLLRALGIDATQTLRRPMERQYILFTSHLGGGKSTELRRLSQLLHDPQRYFVVFVDAVEQLNPNNLHDTDILLKQADLLCAMLAGQGVMIDDVHLYTLKEWFKQRIIVRLNERASSLELTAGLEAKAGIGWLGGLFAKLTSAVKFGTTFREEIRSETKNHLEEFAAGFNQLIRAANAALQRQQLGQRVLFMVDGTDRMPYADMERFFVTDFSELQRIEATFIYCTQVHLLYQHNFLQQRFHYIHRVPMLKIHQRGSDDFWPPALETMRAMVYKRVAPSLFDSEETVDYLIRYSGGHPRDLVRLLELTRIKTRSEIFTREAAEKAVRDMAADFLRFLQGKDYDLLVRIDSQDAQNTQEAEEGTHKLLHTLALLEYNNLWWRSHPLVRTLPGYQKRMHSTHVAG